MISAGLVQGLCVSEEFFNRSTGCLTEEHSGFSPVPGMMSTAQQVAHVAMTIDWFVEGGTRAEGFDLDFEKHAQAIAGVDSLTAARAWLKKSFAHARDVIGAMTDAELTAPLPEGPVMGGMPRMLIADSMIEHTAHHRGALTVYSRLLGLIPAMPYM